MAHARKVVVVVLGLVASACKSEQPMGSALAEVPIEYGGEVVGADGTAIGRDVFAEQGGLLVVVDPTYGKQLPKISSKDLRSGAADETIQTTFTPEQSPADGIAQAGNTVNQGISTVQNAWQTTGLGNTALGGMVQTAATNAATTVRDQYNDYWAKTPVVIAVDQDAIASDVADATGARGIGKIAVKSVIGAKAGPQLQQTAGEQEAAVNAALGETLAQTNQRLFADGSGFARPNVHFGVGKPDLHNNWKTNDQPVDGAYRIYRVNKDGTMRLMNGRRPAANSQGGQ